MTAIGNFHQVHDATIKQALAFCAGLAIAAVTEPCWAIDYQPFDFVPAAPGTMMMMGYYEFENRNEYTTTTGNSITHDTGLTSQIGLARYLYYNQFNGTPFLLEWLQPFGTEYNAKLNGVSLGSASGASDLICPPRFGRSACRNRRLGYRFRIGLRFRRGAIPIQGH